MELVHDPSARRTTIIVLPTSSGKSVLFFSRATMAIEQTVIVVVPFMALVEDLLGRACSYKLDCKE